MENHSSIVENHLPLVDKRTSLAEPYSFVVHDRFLACERLHGLLSKNSIAFGHLLFLLRIMAGASQLALLGLSLQLSLQQEQALMSELQLQIKRKKRSKTRKYWVKPWLTRRLQYGMYHTLMRELMRESEGDFVWNQKVILYG